jgi:hypothetical protein
MAYKRKRLQDWEMPIEMPFCERHPEKRIARSNWANGFRTCGCLECQRERSRGVQAKRRRDRRWRATFIPCPKHLDRRCNRSMFVASGRKRCASCAQYGGSRYRFARQARVVEQLNKLLCPKETKRQIHKRQMAVLWELRRILKSRGRS